MAALRTSALRRVSVREGSSLTVCASRTAETVSSAQARRSFACLRTAEAACRAQATSPSRLVSLV